MTELTVILKDSDRTYRQKFLVYENYTVSEDDSFVLVTVKRSLSINKFRKLVMKGLNCKQIAAEMGYRPGTFGYKMKEVLGVYPSIFIARMKNGKA